MRGWKKKIPYIAACIVIVVLALWYQRLSVKHDPAVDGSLFAPKNGEEVQTITIHNEYGEYSFYQEDGTWMVSDGTDAYYANSDKMSLLTDALLHFPVKRVLDQGQEDYGLDNPRAAAYYKTTEGREYTVVIGNTCADTSECYAAADGQKGILITESAGASQLMGSVAAYRTNDVFQVELASLCSIRYTDPSGQSVTLVREDPDSEWRLTEPVSAGARQLVMKELLSQMAAWSIAGYPETVPEMTEKETLVLTDSSGQTQEISLGAEESTQRYAFLDGGRDAVTLYAADVKLSDFNVESLIYEAPLSADIDKVASLHIAMGEKIYDFEVDAGQQSVTSSGKPVDYEAFTSFYIRYILMLADGWDKQVSAEGMAEEDIAASFETVLKDGSRLGLQLFPGEGDTLLMKCEGIDGLYMQKSRLEELEKRLETL